MLTLSSPGWLVLLALPLIVRWLLPAYRESRAGLFVPSLARVARLTRNEPRAGAVILGRPWVQQFAAAVGWLLLVLAVARPQWVGEPQTKHIASRDLLLAVDLSASMQTEDFQDDSGAKVDRLVAVKQVLSEFLERRDGDRVGLILFGSAAFVQIPFTEDLEVCRQLLDEAQIGMAGPKTVVGDAIGLGITVLDRSELDDKVMILLTDGNDTGSRVPPVEAASIARDREITIHVVAVGDPTGAGEEKLDEETLREVATRAGGGYYRANDREELEGVYREIDSLETRELETLSHRPTAELFQWPLGLVALLSLLHHGVREWLGSRRRTRVASVALLLVFTPIGLSAADVSSAVGAFHFLRPLWLLLIPCGVLLALRMNARLDPLRSLRGEVDEHLLKHLVVGSESRRRWNPARLMLVFWTVAGLALGGPTWRKQPSPFSQDSGVLVIALEVSETMKAQDVQPSRAERARQKISDLLEARAGGRNALVAYAGSAHLVVPATRDAEIFELFLPGIEPSIMPAEGDRPVTAVQLATRHLKESGRSGSVLLVTDGAAGDEVEAMRTHVKESGITVHVLAIGGDLDAVVPPGSPPAPPLDPQALRELASAGGGSLTILTPDDGDVRSVARQVENSLDAALEAEGGERWQDMGYWLGLLLCALASSWFRRGWVVRND